MQKARNVLVPVLALLTIAGPASAQRRARRAATDTPQPTTVILVRHGEKNTSNPFDRNPSLSAAGRRRAQDLMALLRGRHIDAIITTQLVRTQQTAQPLARLLHITPEVVEMKGQGDSTALAIADLIRTRHRGQTVLVVGHNTLVPLAIAALGGPRMGIICESAYSNLFTLTIPAQGTPRYTHTHFGAADPSGGHECVDGIHVDDQDSAGH
jgi:phosphohistidine phosphatase SixA